MLGLFLAAMALSAAAVADDPPKPLTPEQIREQMARVRADLERRRTERERAAPDRQAAPGANKPQQPGQPIAGGRRSRPQKGPEYHFKSGQAFAYSVEFTVGFETSGHVERYSGTPYVSVKSVNRAGEAELFVIGKLECFNRKGSAVDETPNPDRTVWMGSRLALNPAGGSVGKEDVNVKALPSYFRTLSLNLKRLIFPEMPSSVPYVNDSSGNASVFATFTQKSFQGAGFHSLDGRVSRTNHADQDEPPFVRLTQGVSFETNATAKSRVKIDYRSTGRLDGKLGLLRDSDATFRQEREGESPIVGTIRVRLLQGDDVRKAYARALSDWQDRPDVLEPFEFARVRVDAYLPASLQSTRNAQPGMEVLHLRGSNQSLPDADNKYYAVEILEADSAPYGQVKIRYKGSHEVLSVHPATLAFPPSPEHPSRAPRPAKGQ
ncbi:MAG: hypothetical protein P4L84_05015 [Isosphaeraceae bacterium]|nr:hypothetical protein [Isosphaeraceae bacterium]